MKITLEINGKEVTMTKEEACQLHAELDAIFGNKAVPVPIYPVPHAPAYPPPITPYEPNKFWCADRSAFYEEQG